jgi:hypothetical protein
LLVGTSTARSQQGVITKLQVENTDYDGISFVVNGGTTANRGPVILLGRSRGSALNSSTAVASGDRLGLISFQGADGTDIETAAASIECLVDGTPGANDMPGRLVFSTTADGASSPTERMRITNGGLFLVGCTSLPSASVGGFGVAANGDVAIASTITGSDRLVEFFNPNGRVGGILVSGSATTFETSSDYRLKENVVPLTGAINRLQQIPVHRFNFIADPDTVVDGFIAHEAQAVVPECVTGTKDEVDEDGNPVYQGIDQSKLVPLLTAALQEAITEIASLKDRVAALEGV